MRKYVFAGGMPPIRRRVTALHREGRAAAAEVDEYLTAARSTFDPDERAEYYAKFQKELAENPPYTFFCYIDADYVADASIQGIASQTVLGHHGVGIFWNVEDWTIG